MTLPEPAARWSSLRLLWFALVASQVTLGLVLWFVHFGPAAGQAMPPASSVRFDLPFFAIGAAVLTSASVRLPRWHLRSRARLLDLPRSGVLDDAATARVLPFALASLVLALGLAEGVAMLGFVQGFLGAPPRQFIPFFVVALLLAARCFPGESWLDRELG
jgi:hypothetical protein